METPSIIPVQSGFGWSTSTHAYMPWVGRKSRSEPSAVMLSRIPERIARPTAPPTAPSGASVSVDIHRAKPATVSSQTKR
jgi:hypothetical protein